MHWGGPSRGRRAHFPPFALCLFHIQNHDVGYTGARENDPTTHGPWLGGPFAGLLLLGAVGYFGGGILYNRRLKGGAGGPQLPLWEALPHKAVWQEVRGRLEYVAAVCETTVL